MSCDDCRELAPEFALGILDGAERARVLRHVVSCPNCRAYVDELGRTADSLLLAGPEAEPPLGFEASTIALLRVAPPRASRWRPFAAAAAVAVLAAGAGVVIGQQTVDDPLRSAPLVAANGARVGRVFLYDRDNSPSWCYLSLSGPGAHGDYEVHAELRDGSVVLIQKFSVETGEAAYGAQMTVDADDIVEMRVGSANSKWTATADLAT
jgi:hypothetical protein